MMSETLSCITLETGNDPQHCIIWLHGLGADGGDFVPVAEQINLPVPVRYVFPHAPMRPVTVNGGYVMRAWYDIYAAAPGQAGLIAESDRLQDAEGIRAAQAEVEKLIARERQRGVAEQNIFLAGFSQGGAVVLHTGLRHAGRLGGILALSTYLPLAGTLAQEAGPAMTQIPVFMAHGRADPVVPYALGRASAQRLSESGCTVDWHEYEMAHAVCLEEIVDIEGWLAQRLG